VGIYGASEVTGSKNENLRLSMYLVLPIYESIGEAKKKNPLAWLGIKYTDSIKNNLSNPEKERKIEAFLNRSQEDFDSKNVQKFVYLDRIGSSDDLDGYKKALETSSKFNLNNDIILVPAYTPFESRNGNKFGWIFLSYALGSFIWLLLISKPKINEGALLSGNAEEQENGISEFISMFMIPTKDFFVTPILIDLNIFLFLLLFVQGHGFMSVKSDDLMLWGANYGPSISNGEYWRLLSSIFLHGGMIHLAGNIFGLTLIGPILEPILGKAKFVFAYLATGIIASLSSIYWHDAIVSVGASGAIFGLCGVFLALIATNVFHHYFDMEFSSYLMSLIGTFIVCNLVIGFFMENVDNAAHIGGVLSGFILGLLQSILFRFKATQKQKS
jgi:membrane associated rhomboid family serine protease